MNQLRTYVSAALIGGFLALTPRSSAADDQGPGLIGKQYAGLDFTLDHPHSHWLDNADGGIATVNLPLAPGYDAAVDYGLAHQTGTNFSQRENRFSASLIAYNHDEYGKPYLAVSLGHVSDRVDLMGTTTNYNSNIWAVGAGIEVPYGNSAAVNFGVTYSDSFNTNGWNTRWLYRVQGNYWFTPKVAGIASVSYNQIKNAPDTVLYSVGVRFLF